MSADGKTVAFASPEARALGLAVMNAGKPLAALNGDATPILDRLYAGETAKAIAESFGISHVALYAWMLHNCPEQWQAISAAQSLTRMEKAEGELNDKTQTPDKVSVTRSAAAAKLAQWSLERTSRKLYGENKADNSGITVQVLIQRDGITINGESA